MPVRVLLSSFLLALILFAGIAGGASAESKGAKAKIALGAHKHAAKKSKRARKCKRVRKHRHARTRRHARKCGHGHVRKHKHARKRTRARTAATPGSAKRPAAQPTPPPVTAQPAPAACANTTLTPAAGNLELVREAIVCLHNQIRAQNGLGTLAPNGQLAGAAAGHSDDMVAGHYFAHDTPAGGTFVDRVLAAGYAAPDGAWTLGENLAWGTGELSTPAGMLNAWMNSPGHRANLLNGAYREIGVGIRLGTPTGSAAGATVSVEFGARS